MACRRPHFEAQVINDDGFLIFVMSLDLRDPETETRTSRLVLPCRERDAIDLGQLVCLQSIEALRTQDGRYAASLSPLGSHTEPLHAHPYTQHARASEAGASQRREWEVSGARTSEVANSDEAWQSYADNAWVLRAMIEPSDPTEHTEWDKKLDSTHVHLLPINRPREFSRALGSMVTDQLGPLCAEQDFSHRWAEGASYTTQHLTQMVLHGPVIYTATPDQVIEESPTEGEFLIRSLFVEQLAFREEREYRFVVVSETKPNRNEIYLLPSNALLSSLGVKSAP